MKKVLQAKAATLTEAGEFTAIAAAYSVDRANERIIPGAFKTTIDHWQGSGKNIPLHWDHSGDPHDIIGTVDPSSVSETSQGLEVKGTLDLQESEQAREAWRLIKKNAVGLSFGYLVVDSSKAKDGVVELKALDVFEISITPAPANADTRILNWKSLAPAEVAERARGMADQIATGDFDKGVTAERLRGFAARVASMEKAAAEAEEHRQRLEVQRLEQERQAKELAEVPEPDPEPEPEPPTPEEQLKSALEALDDEALENLSQDVKDELAAKARQVQPQVEEAPAQKAQAQDPLKQASLALSLEVLSDGASLHKHEEAKPEPKPEAPSDDAQRRRLIADLYL